LRAWSSVAVKSTVRLPGMARHDLAGPASHPHRLLHPTTTQLDGGAFMSLKPPRNTLPRNNRSRSFKVPPTDIASVREPVAILVLAAAATTIILFALTPATTLVAAAQIDGLSIGIIRTVGGGLVALPLLLVFRLRPPQRWNDWKLLILSAIGSFAGFPILFSLGSQRTSASHAALTWPSCHCW
jgi:hypothetical protein